MSDEEQGQEPTFEQLHQKYSELLALVRSATRHDPRSCDMAMVRLEESLFWTSIGVNKNGNNER